MAPATAVIEYVFVVDEQTEAEPVIGPGVGGAGKAKSWLWFIKNITKERIKVIFFIGLFILNVFKGLILTSEIKYLLQKQTYINFL